MESDYDQVVTGFTIESLGSDVINSHVYFVSSRV
jgi:hypothetical protein